MVSLNHHYVVYYNLKDPTLEILDIMCPNEDLHLSAYQNINLLVIFYTFDVEL